MIGPNDFCLDICYKNKPEDILEEHRKHLHIVLRTLKQMPRTLVQIVISPSKFYIIYNFTLNIYTHN